MNSRWRWLAARIAWGSLLILHGAVLLRCFTSPEAWFGQQIAVAAAMLLFALKTVDVRFLRMRLTRQSVVAGMLVVALLHVDVLRRESWNSSAALWALPAVVCLTAVPRPQVWRQLGRLIEAVASAYALIRLWVRAHWLRPGMTLTHRQRLRWLCGAPPRSPPLPI